MTESSDHQGKYYLQVLSDIHHVFQPTTYLEIGSQDGNSLALASCGSVAVDLKFDFKRPEIVGMKPFCYLFQMTSDAFFKRFNPRDLLSHPVEFAFLDGLHRCEYLLRDFANTERNCVTNSIIAMHDCLPPEAPIAERSFGHRLVDSNHSGWWAGDVWRTLLALRKWRPDLSIYAFDSQPTGLVFVTNVDPTSTKIWDNYKQIVEDMLEYDLYQIGIKQFFEMVDVRSTKSIDTAEKLTRLFWI